MVTYGLGEARSPWSHPPSAGDNPEEPFQLQSWVGVKGCCGLCGHHTVAQGTSPPSLACFHINFQALEFIGVF